MPVCGSSCMKHTYPSTCHPNLLNVPINSALKMWLLSLFQWHLVESNAKAFENTDPWTIEAHCPPSLEHLFLTHLKCFSLFGRHDEQLCARGHVCLLWPFRLWPSGPEVLVVEEAHHLHTAGREGLLVGLIALPHVTWSILGQSLTWTSSSSSCSSFSSIIIITFFPVSHARLIFSFHSISDPIVVVLSFQSGLWCGKLISCLSPVPARHPRERQC